MRVWDWMHLAQATDDWWGYVNAIMQGCTIFLKNWEAFKFLSARRLT